MSPLATVALFHHLSTSLRRCFFSLLSYSATRLREYILCCIRRTAILKNNNTAEKRREEEAFGLASIAHYCFVEIKSNCAQCLLSTLKNGGSDQFSGFLRVRNGKLQILWKMIVWRLVNPKTLDGQVLGDVN